MRKLDPTTFVSVRQLTAGDVDEAAALGVRLIVNNRPDGEEPGQPSSAEIETAARAAGLDYRHIPNAGGFPPEQVEAMAEALEQGPVLAFCRTGTRSTYLWALARAAGGAPAEELAAAASAAGYDLGPIRGLL
ncbi:MAG TPA: TIGR01244 family sulfur transferase [Allosphingosinicella sp.]|nr:TIGR01244 family sulfur transferase [Allosphingosinicella sp.]